MEKEELLEMINSTIITNGNGNITGHALNLALNAIVENMGSGGSVEIDYLDPHLENGGTISAELYNLIQGYILSGIVIQLSTTNGLFNNIANKIDTDQLILQFIDTMGDSTNLVTFTINSNYEYTVTKSKIIHSIATSTSDGLMSSNDKLKLDRLVGASFLSLTQEEYDALQVKDPEVLYLIID